MTHDSNSKTDFTVGINDRFRYLFSSVFGLLLVLTASTAVAFAVYGLIGDKYKQLGGPTGLMGAPLNDESPAANGGRFNRFQHGYIYWHPKTGAHMVFGAIADKYRELGLEKSPVGYPTSDEYAAGGGGRRSNFQGGMIFWHPSTGAHAVYGLIGAKWLASGGENGDCGFPTSDEMEGPGYVIRPGYSVRTRYSNFQHGQITWVAKDKEAYATCTPKGSSGVPIQNPREVYCPKGSKYC